MNRILAAIALGCTLLVHPASDPHSHTEVFKPALVSQHTPAGFVTVKKLRVAVGDSMNEWADAVAIL